MVKYNLDEKEHEFKSKNNKEGIKKTDWGRTFLSVLDIKIDYSFKAKIC